MITKPTVFVLGAGASIPYGYPSGKNLIKTIYEKIITNEWRNIFSICGIVEEHIQEFRFELKESQRLSIDGFLEHRQEYKKVGKLSIAMALLELEDDDRITSFEVRDKGIYHYIFDRLNSECTEWDEFRKNKVSFITFN